MLDISITNADKIVSDKKGVDQGKAIRFLDQMFTVEEKFDGTKLTLWRNDKPFNSDYTENWVVAYKNRVIWPEEFKDANRDDIRAKSIGYGQYALIHDHLRSIQENIRSIPRNTEFFLEFIQNKPTTTRDYQTYHDLYLIAWSPAEATIQGGAIHTSPEGFYQDNLETLANTLQLNLPPMVFYGNPSTVEGFEKGIQSTELRKSFELHRNEFSSDLYGAVKRTFQDMESVIGGKPEGVVLKTEDGQFYKILQDDQHDRAKRYEKKLRFMGSDEEETAYWANVNQISTQLLSQTTATDTKDRLRELGQLAYRVQDSEIQHPKRDISKIRDDIMLTARNILLDSLPENQNALMLGRFQPLTKAHADIIRHGLEKYNRVYVALVKGGIVDTDRNPFPLELQKEMIDALGFGSRVQVITSPTGAIVPMLGKIRDTIVAVLCGEDRAQGYRDQLKRSKIAVVETPRTVDDISATKVRNAINTNDKETFLNLTDPSTHKFYGKMKAILVQYGPK